MAVEIRPAVAEEMEDYTRVGATALGVRYDEPWHLPPEETLCAFEDGRLATTYRAIPLSMCFNSKVAPVAGISAVGTLPIYRRRGYLRAIVSTHFEQMHEKGERAIAILYPSQGAIYQRYGYAFVSTHHRYGFEPRHLQFREPASPAGVFRDVTEEDSGVMPGIYDSFVEGRTGYLTRDVHHWQWHYRHPPASGVRMPTVYEEAGTPLAYVVYTLEATGPGAGDQVITIHDMAYLTMPAYRAIWDYLGSMDLIGTIKWGRVPADDPLPYLLLDPRRLGTGSYAGLMGRIVDVERALPWRTYPVEARLTFELRDGLCSWNDGRWEVEIAAGEASVRRTEATPQLVMPVSTLALLVFNHITATEAARIGCLDVLEQSALPAWDAAMRTTYRPFCADGF